MEFPTIEELSRRVAEEAKKALWINEMPLEEFIVNVDEVVTILKKEVNKNVETAHTEFCKKLLELLGA